MRKGQPVRKRADLRLDLLVEEKVIVDLKAKEMVTAVDRQKLLSYLRLSHKKLGLIINFHVTKLKDGVERIVNGLTEQLAEIRIEILTQRALRTQRKNAEVRRVRKKNRTQSVNTSCLYDRVSFYHHLIQNGVFLKREAFTLCDLCGLYVLIFYLKL